MDAEDRRLERILDSRDIRTLPFEVIFLEPITLDHERWLTQHCTGKYRIYNGRRGRFFVGFENEEDMVAFNLTYL